MFAVTRNGARLLDGREDWTLLDSLIVGVALSLGYQGSSRIPGTGRGSAGALDFLISLDPPMSDDDVVIWAWTDEPAKSRHVSCPRPAPAAAKPRRTVARAA